MGYYQVNLRDMVAEIGEDDTKIILSFYKCPQNADIECFLRDKSIEFTKQGIAATHLIFTSLKAKPVLVGYFALTNKSIYIPKRSLNSNYQKRIKRFGLTHDSGYIIPTLLVAQLGKNFANGYKDLISGDELLKMAIDKIQQIQFDIGGKFVYLECEDIDKLIDFYSSHGFFKIGNRFLDRHEKRIETAEYYVQMLRYIK